MPRRFRIARIQDLERPRLGDWASALRGFDAAAAETFKSEGSSRVYRATVLGRPVVVKTRELRGFGEWVKWASGAARGFRHWRGAVILMRLGLDVAQPILLAREGRREWLVLDYLDGKTLLQHIADGDLAVRDEHVVARALGRHISTLRKAGWFNRDFKPSNIMVRPDLTIASLDCVAIRRGGDGADRMLHALAVEPLGLKILPRRALMARVVCSMVEADFEGSSEDGPALRMAKWATRRAFWGLVRESIARHGDPTPRVNPLAGSG